MKYIIVEQGEYSDYGVSIVDITDCSLEKEEILRLLELDQYDKPAISGEISGEIKFYGNSSISVKNIKEEAECNINRMFDCYSYKAKHKTVLDRKYTKVELFKIAIANDSSGEDYWKQHIDKKYEKYIKGFELYQKLIKGRY